MQQAIALLDLMVLEDVTPQLQAEADSVDVESKEASRKLEARRPVQNYREMGMPPGSVLEFNDGERHCTVSSDRRVEFNGEDFSLTALTKKLLGTERPLQPSPYWSYKGTKLSDIYEETYETP